jgi:hypothetical protein
MRPNRLSRLLAGAAAAAALVATPATVLAATASPAAAGPSAQPSAPAKTITFGVRPADEREYFHVDLARGATSVRPAVITNFASTPVELLVYGADATITPQGGFALAEREVAAKTVGTWIHLPIGRVHLAGNASTVVKFPITVPDGTDPGDYAGGVIVERIEPGKATTVQDGFAVQFDIVQRVGARIYLHVDGEARTGMKVGKLTWQRGGGGITFKVPVTNTGNVRLTPTARLNLKGFNLPSEPISTSRVEELLPGSTVEITGKLTRPPLFGSGEATATVDDGTGNHKAAVAPVSLIPILPIVGSLVLLTLAGFAVRRYLRFLRRARVALKLADTVHA